MTADQAKILSNVANLNIEMYSQRWRGIKLDYGATD